MRPGIIEGDARLTPPLLDLAKDPVQELERIIARMEASLGEPSLSPSTFSRQMSAKMRGVFEAAKWKERQAVAKSFWEENSRSFVARLSPLGEALSDTLIDAYFVPKQEYSNWWKQARRFFASAYPPPWADDVYGGGMVARFATSSVMTRRAGDDHDDPYDGVVIATYLTPSLMEEEEEDSLIASLKVFVRSLATFAVPRRTLAFLPDAVSPASNGKLTRVSRACERLGYVVMRYPSERFDLRRARGVFEAVVEEVWGGMEDGVRHRSPLF